MRLIGCCATATRRRSATVKIDAGIWHLEPHVAHRRYFILCYEKLEFEILKLDSRLVISGFEELVADNVFLTKA